MAVVGFSAAVCDYDSKRLVGATPPPLTIQPARRGVLMNQSRFSLNP